MSDLLSPEERTALQALHSAAPAAGVAPAVFPSVSQLDPERTIAVNAVLRRWLEMVTGDLSRHLRYPCSSSMPRHSVVPRMSLPGLADEAFWARVEGGTGHVILVAIPRAFGAAICERAFGAPLKVQPERALTTSEASLLRDLVRMWLLDLGRFWDGHTIRPCRSSEVADLAPEEDAVSWMQFTAEVQCGPIASSLSVCMAAGTARWLLGNPQDIDLLPEPEAASLARFGDVPVDVSGVLGKTELTLDEISGLRVGDVLTLSRRSGDLVEVFIDQQPAFRARTGLSGNQVAFEIIARLDQEGNEK